MKINNVGKLVWVITGILHLALIPIFLGIWTAIPSYVQIFSNWIHLIVGLYLVIRFRPFQTNITFNNYDRALVCASGIFMLEALIASTLFISPWGILITQYLQSEWLPWIQKYVNIPTITPTGKKTSVMNNKTPNPNVTPTSLGGSASYSLLD